MDQAPPALLDLLAQHVTINLEAEPLTGVMVVLQKVTGSNLVVSPTLISPKRTITLRVTDISFKQTLSLLADLHGLSITAVDGALFVSEPEPTAPAAAPQPNQATGPAR